MGLVPESNTINDYIIELPEINFMHPFIASKSKELFNSARTDIEKIQVAFEFVRDKIAHSWDIQSHRVTCNASEVLSFGEGICYAKSHLLAALLRSQGIPTGFCYQRLMLSDVPEKGYCIHGLNAVYLQSLKKWIRLDARGNKPGIDAQFSIYEEKIAFPVQVEYDEKDYSVIYAKPHPKVIATLQAHTDAVEMCKHYLPDYL